MTNKFQPYSWTRLLLNQTLKNPTKTPLLFSRKISTFPHFSTCQTPQIPIPSNIHLPNASKRNPTKPIFSFSRKISTFRLFRANQTPRCHFSSYSRAAQDLLTELEREKQKEREARERLGLDTKDIDAEDEEDYMGVGPLIEKLEKEKLKNISPEELNRYEEPTDSDSDEDDERFSREAVQKRYQLFEKKIQRHEELLQGFADAGMVYKFR